MNKISKIALIATLGTMFSGCSYKYITKCPEFKDGKCIGKSKSELYIKCKDSVKTKSGLCCKF